MRIYLLISSLIIISNVLAQTQLGLRQSNYGGINSVITKPASGFDLPNNWDLNLVSAGLFVENEYVYFKNTTVPKIITNNDNTYFDNPFALASEIKPKPANALEYTYYDASNKMNFIVSSTITGPSFLWSGDKYSIGIFSNLRSHVNGRNLDPNLDFYSIDNWIDGETKSFNAINITLMNWAEIGLNFAKQFSFSDGKLALGFNAKYLMGYDAVFVNTSDNASITILPNSTRINTGLINVGYTNSYDNGYKFNRNGSGLGFDIGLNYTKDSDDDRPYIFRTSVNLIDMGYIYFNKNTFDHSIDINNSVDVNKGTFEGLDGLIKYTDSLSQAALGTPKGSIIDNAFNMNLPMGFLIDFDYSLHPNIFINAKVERPIVINSHTLQRAKTMSISPRYESKWFEFGLPIVMYNDKKVRLGTWLKLGYLTIGSDHILSFLSNQKELSGTDIYFGLKIMPFNLSNRSGSNSSNGCKKGRRNRDKCYSF